MVWNFSLVFVRDTNLTTTAKKCIIIIIAYEQKVI